MELKQYKITANPINSFELIVTAHTKESAWGKFCTQRFGVLKPNPGNYLVTFYQNIGV